jgi:CubicO group peptidase (beta-lactamase class C family)
VAQRGLRVVDLWGGRVGAAPHDAPWSADTLVCVFSATKAAAALTVHALAAAAALDLDASLADLWPAYAAEGKGGTTLRMVLDHSAGVPVLRDPVKADALLDHAYMAERVAAEAPWWEPGSRTGYHPFTFGTILAEAVLRATGLPIGTVFAERIARPLGIDLHIGLPEAEEARVAPSILYRPPRDAAPSAFIAAARRQGTLQNLFAFNHGTWATRGVNTRDGRAAGNPAAGGMASARGLCALFAAVATPAAAARIGLDTAQVASFACATSATQRDATLLQPTRFGPGFMLSIDGRRAGADSFVIGSGAFGHVGAGGAAGFADPDLGLAFGYAMNAQGPGLLMNARGQALVDAVYRASGAATDAPGFWVTAR